MEFFPAPTSDRFGTDPRKHAISVCYALDAVGDFVATPGGEGKKFEWFPPDHIGDLATWPGTATLVEKTIAATDPDGPEILASMRVAYTSISDEALNTNALAWQTPALALTAQSFLLTIALGAGASVTARLVASGLNLIFSVLCLQLMAKHRAIAARNRDVLVGMERYLGLPAHHEKTPSDTFSGLARYTSGNWWIFGFVVLALVAMGIFVTAVAGLQWAQWWSRICS